MIVITPRKKGKVTARVKATSRYPEEIESSYRHRRAYLDDLRNQKVMTYKQSLALASALLGRLVTEYGQLSISELHTVTNFISRDYRGFDSNEYLGTTRIRKAQHTALS